jgi:hypothetical protein
MKRTGMPVLAVPEVFWSSSHKAPSPAISQHQPTSGEPVHPIGSRGPRAGAAVGNRVVSLHRERIGQIQLDVDVGQWRYLTADEVLSFSR